MTLKTILAAALAASTALAQGLAYPAGLQPGDEYRVLFVSDSTRDATATDIGVYDALVAADADAVPFLASLPTSWHAVGSSAAVSAKDHTGTAGGGGVPIFRPDGVRIADDYDHLWGTNGGAALHAAPEVTASGTLTTDFVWTGTMADGNTHSWPFGGVSQLVIAGRPYLTGLDWVSANTRPVTDSYRLYGISDVLRVPYPDYPRDLKPGDQFRVLFVTDSTRDGTSSNIADYDAFVTADAQAAPELQLYGTGWRAVASTPFVTARNHTGTNGVGVPIYRPDGVRLTNDYPSMWGSLGLNAMFAPPHVTASGVVTSGQVWTGTSSDGSGGFLSRLGESFGSATTGDCGTASISWVMSNTANLSSQRPLYGISDVITVPEPQHPADLQPGQQYRVLFVTDGLRDATSTDIADYDAFVADDADAVAAMRLYDTQWRAVASTPTVAASEHTDTDPNVVGLPIYRPDGTRIADDNLIFWGWSGLIPLQAAPNVTASGVVTPASHAWTGTHNGNIYTYPLGSPAGIVRVGEPHEPNFRWRSRTQLPVTSLLPLYGISAVITVPFPAIEQSRVGTPSNADALLPGQTSGPIIGRTWDPIVDHTTFVTDAVIDVLFFGEAQANVPLPGFGTVLVDQLLGSNLVALAGQAFALSIPDSASLLGVSVSTQALSLDVAWGMHLSNALDITIGDR